MSSLADSDAYFDPERMLAQHQAAITLLQGKLADPRVTRVNWLDLACGRGQVLVSLSRNLSPEERRKIHLIGYDIENAFTRDASRIASRLELGDFAMEIGALPDFTANPRMKKQWDFITLTNTIHEIAPSTVATILINCIVHLSDIGTLFVYDMERLPKPELGAVPWTGPEMRALMSVLVKSLGCSSYEPSVGTWSHKTCEGWNVQINRSHMDLPADFRDGIESAVSATAAKITELLQLKLNQTRTILEALTQHGPETGEEAENKERYLYDYWAISRSVEASK